MSLIAAPPATRNDQDPPTPVETDRSPVLLLGTYAVMLAVFVVVIGIPFNWPVLFVLVVLTLSVVSVATGRFAVTAVFRDWGALAAVMLLYTYSRGIADAVGMPLQLGSLIALDEWVGVGRIPTVWLQEHILDLRSDPVHWWELSMAFTYASHFLASFTVAAFLWVRDRELWLSFIARLITLTAMGLATYVLLPAAPPWMAAEQGLIDDVGRGVFRSWHLVGLGFADGLIELGRATTNDVAALPSLHCGYAALLFAFFGPRVGRIGRALLGSYALYMAFTVVLTAEHWVVDALLAWVYVAVVMRIWARIDERRARTPGRDQLPSWSSSSADRQSSSGWTKSA